MREWLTLLSPRGLRVQILLWTILPLTLLLIAFSLTGVRSHQRSMRSLVAERDVGLAQVLSRDISTLLNGFTSRLQILADSVVLRVSDSQAKNTTLIQADQWLDGITLLLTNSAMEVVVGPEESPLWIPETLNALQDVAPITDQPSVVVTADEHILVWRFPLGEGGGWLLGALPVSSLPLAELLDAGSLSAAGSINLVDRDEHILFASDSSLAVETTVDASAVVQALAGESGVRFAPGPHGEQVIAYAPVKGPGWALVLREPWEPLTAPLLHFDRVMPFVLVTAAVASLLTLIFGLRYVAQPLQRLGAQADRIGRGDFEAAAQPVSAVREIEELRQTLDRMARQVQRYQTALQDYLSSLTQAQEEERAHLARELHDETVQTLIALHHRAQMVQRLLVSKPERAEVRLAELRTMIGQAIEEVRRFSRALRPLYLEELGLVPALEMLAREADTTFQVTGPVRRLPPDHELALYRVVQEALSNVQRHAQARRTRVVLAFTGVGITLKVKDDGVGFPVPDRLTDLARYGHFGLLGMYERVLRVGGQLTIASAPGHGTLVEVRLPHKNEAGLTPSIV